MKFFLQKPFLFLYKLFKNTFLKESVVEKIRAFKIYIKSHAQLRALVEALQIFKWNKESIKAKCSGISTIKSCVQGDMTHPNVTLSNIKHYRFRYIVAHSACLCMLAVIVGITTCFASSITDNLLVYKNYKKTKALLQKKLVRLQYNCAYQQNYLFHLTEDVEFLERVTRHQLDYAKPHEIIFKFRTDRKPLH